MARGWPKGSGHFGGGGEASKETHYLPIRPPGARVRLRGHAVGYRSAKSPWPRGRRPRTRSRRVLGH
eukprot:2748502-Pleurochrysis_carterae.AAC.1